VGHAGSGHPSGEGPARHPQGLGAFCQPASGQAVSGTVGRLLSASGHRGQRPRRHGRAGADRRGLFRRTAGHRGTRRREGRLQHHGLCRARSAPHRQGRLRDGPQASGQALLRGQGQRARRLAPVAGRGAGSGQGLSRRGAVPPVRGQRRHAARARSVPVRRHRDRKSFRRHPLRRGGGDHRLHRHVAVGVAWRGQSRPL